MAVKAFMRQVDRYFEKTTFAFTCNNWAKRTSNGRMIGYWPGSAVHQRATLATPRFEDFEYSSFQSEEADCLAWMGDGMIVAQKEGTSTTGYLDIVDIPPDLRLLHEASAAESPTIYTPASLADEIPAV
ncbi:hypothetical protein LTR56_015920 [Elasticomyces elasticus]|nr:hypothetical protein LTR56_015920 [Elasticomyces elasticus]KAK3655323.1 hypothetical protein LTR22_010353 [Elasticomyces elasticus]KAK4918679.1 hypothetical protein LTR49_013604 [Elasticomyces elasticus]KAK5751971.1 hypothetical protein LTS12_017987 [Elasticomyces elasticus]